MVPYYIDGAGIRTYLNTPDLRVLTFDGLGMADFEFETTRYPGQHGDSVLGVVAEVRSIALTIQARGGSYAGIEALRRKLVTIFNPKAGPGVFGLELPSGAVRELRQVYYRSGLGFDDSGQPGVIGNLRVVVRLEAHDPLWYDAAEQQTTVALTQPGGFVLPATFPIYLGPSGIAESIVVDNPGDVDSWMTIVITGPGLQPRVANRTTGRSLLVDRRLVAGDQLTIQMHPETRDILLTTGDVTVSVLADRKGRFWSVVPGTNSIEVSMLEAQGGSINLRFPPPYLGV